MRFIRLCRARLAAAPDVHRRRCLPLLKELRQYTASISYNPDFSDYIYDADLLRDLSGKAMHKSATTSTGFTGYIRLYLRADSSGPSGGSYGPGSGLVR